MKKFKVGDLVYCPKYTNQIITLNHRYDEQDFYILQFAYDEGAVATFANNGFENLGSDLTPSIFHATKENHKLLSKLYPNVEFEPPQKEPREIIKAMLESGWAYVACRLCDDKRFDYVGLVHCIDDSNSYPFIGDSEWKYAIPFDPKTGKAIIDFVDGEVVLEN